MIGLEQLQRLFDHLHRAVAGALLGLGGEKRLVAPLGHDLANVLLAPSLGAAVDRGGVDVVDAEVERALDDGHGGVEVVGVFECGLSAERKDSNLEAGFAEITRGHCSGRARIRRQFGQGLIGGYGERGRREQSGCDRTADFQEFAAALRAGRFRIHFAHFDRSLRGGTSASP